jgi:hypothetical protein
MAHQLMTNAVPEGNSVIVRRLWERGEKKGRGIWKLPIAGHDIPPILAAEGMIYSRIAVVNRFLIECPVFVGCVACPLFKKPAE